MKAALVSAEPKSEEVARLLLEDIGYEIVVDGSDPAEARAAADEGLVSLIVVTFSTDTEPKDEHDAIRYFHKLDMVRYVRRKRHALDPRVLCIVAHLASSAVDALWEAGANEIIDRQQPDWHRNLENAFAVYKE